MTSRNASIAGGIAGIVGWVVFFVAFVLAPTPPTLGASATDIVREAAWLYLAFLAGAIVTLSVNVSASFIWMALSGRGWTAGDATSQTLSDIINYGYIFIADIARAPWLHPYAVFFHEGAQTCA